MDGDLPATELRTNREKGAWSNDQIVLAQAFKKRIPAAFDNPHGSRMEAERDQVIRRRCPGAAVLDYGCYEGLETVKYLGYGAESVCGIDLSETAIGRARSSIPSPRATFMVADAHRLPFDDGAFNLIVGRAILHHLELKRAFSEISRVLSPGGLATFVEPLRGNPLSKVVRILTPKARTPDELPLSSGDILLGDRLIGPGRHRYSGFISAPLGAVVSLCGGRTDHWLLRLASAGDEAIERTRLKYWGRIVFLTFEKSSS